MYIQQHGKLNSPKTLLVILYKCMYIINKFITTESEFLVFWNQTGGGIMMNCC